MTTGAIVAAATRIQPTDGHEPVGGGPPGVHDAPRPAVVCGCGHLTLADVERDRREGDLVLEVLEAAARLLQVELHLVQLRLHRERLGDGVRLVEQVQELAFDGLEMALARLEVDEFLRDVLSSFLAPLDLAEPRELLHHARVAPLGDAEDKAPADEPPLVAALRGAGLDDEAAARGREQARPVDHLLEVVPRDRERQRRRLDDARPDRGNGAPLGHGDGVLATAGLGFARRRPPSLPRRRPHRRRPHSRRRRSRTSRPRR